jgi:glycerophosphoryl diester phosphodiesterase
MPNSPFARPIAHRGFHDRSKGIIENSKSAFDAAITHNLGIECDLQLTGDGEVVVFHDHDLERLTGNRGNIHAVSGADICSMPLLDSATGDTPQKFAEFLVQIAGRVPLVVEIKQQPTAEGNAAIAQKAVEIAKGYSGPFVFKSFDPTVLQAVRKAGYAGELGVITYRYDTPDWDSHIPALQKLMLRHLLHWPLSRFTFISCERNSLALPAVRLCRALGMKVMSWTVKEKAQMPGVLKQADQIVFEGFDPDS